MGSAEHDSMRDEPHLDEHLQQGAAGAGPSPNARFARWGVSDDAQGPMPGGNQDASPDCDSLRRPARNPCRDQDERRLVGGLRMRTIVAGSRSFNSPELLEYVLDR